MSVCGLCVQMSMNVKILIVVPLTLLVIIHLGPMFALVRSGSEMMG